MKWTAFLVAAAVLALVGCATTEPSVVSRSGYSKQSAEKSMAKLAAPVFFGFGKGRPNDRLLMRLEVSEWAPAALVDADGRKVIEHVIADAKPYLLVRFKPQAKREREFFDASLLSGIAWTSKEEAEITTAAAVYKGVGSLTLLACPAGLSRPSLEDCLIAAGVNYQIQAPGQEIESRTGTYAQGDQERENLFLRLAERYQEVSLIDGSEAQKIFKARNDSWMAEKASAEAASRLIAVRQAEAEKRRVEKIMKSSPVGTVMFCDTDDLSEIEANQSIASAKYNCDKTGDALISLKDMSKNFWKIVFQSKMRVRYVAGGIKYSVSLQVRKFK